ncbi:nucleotidyltransferase family protein [Nocardioides sp. AN3]
MKAFLLAAGLGTRLRPLTDRVPKCLVDIGGRPLLDIWLDALASAGIDEVLVNVHHLHHLVEEHVAARAARAPFVKIAHEPTLLGSAGTLRANRDFVEREPFFLAINADNLTTFDIRRLMEAHHDAPSLATLAVFRAPHPERCGILTVEDGLVVAFEEKPTHPVGNLANAGLYAFDPRVLDLVQGDDPLDIGGHLLPKLVGRSRVLEVGDSFFVDIGTPEALEQARATWPRGAQR